MILPADESHHLAHVLRAAVGQPVVVFDGEGREADAEIAAIGRDGVTVKLMQQRQISRLPVAFTLIQALPREQKMDLVLQKGTELGIAEILPVVSDHGVVRLRERGEAKRERWEKIILNAAKQCGVAWLPRVGEPRGLMETLGDLTRFDLLILCSLEPDARPLREVIAEARPLAPRSIALLVGPEGDFSSRELGAARRVGARPVTLGPHVLRAETAALYALSILKYEFCG